MLAVIWGNPPAPGARLIPLMVMRRPLISRLLPRLVTKLCSRLKKSARWKKLPLSVKVNCSVGSPAAPTAAPGGSGESVVLAELAPAALVALELELEPEPEPEPEPELGGELELGGVVEPPAGALPSCRPRKLTFAPWAAFCTW